MGGEPELKLLVHASQAGGIIGKAGARIKELRQVKCRQFCCLYK